MSEHEYLAALLDQVALFGWLDQDPLSPSTAAYFRRAAALLREARPQPVPVAERPWEREGWCDAEGRCWWGICPDEFFNPEWAFATQSEVDEYFDSAIPQVSLPHWAIPIPTPTETPKQ